MFGKKKKKDTAKASAKEEPAKSDIKSDRGSDGGSGENGEADGKKPDGKSKRKKFFHVKKIIIILLLLGIAASAGFFVYTQYFTGKAHDKTKTYTSIKLKYIILPDEILKFTFDYFPALYASFVSFNHTIILVNGEITRIEDIGKRYPLDKNIADKERKIWEKTRDKALKNFKKIENRTEAVYVLFQVNRQQGMEKIKGVRQEFESSAEEALTPVLKLTARLKNKSRATIPRGFIKGTIYRLRKKFGF